MGATARDVTVLIPAFNEAERLPAVLAGLYALDDVARVVVVDDGSTDETTRVAKAGGATVLTLPFNQGYGAALQTGYKFALQCDTTLVVQMDADGQHVPADIPRLVDPVRDGEADLVIGSRFVEQTAYQMSGIRNVGRKLFQRLARRSGLDVTDPTSGFQAMNRSVLALYAREFFPSDYPDIDVLLAAHKAGIVIAERSVEMLPETRKSTMHGGLRSIYYVYRLALSLWAGSRVRAS